MMLQQFTAARERGVPILAIRTADQLATVDAIAAVSKECPVITWDAVRGLAPRGTLGKQALFTAIPVDVPKQDERGRSLPPAQVEAAALAQIGSDTIGFAEAMLALQKLPKTTLVCAFNAHRQLQSQEPLATAPAIQAVSNLRDTFKQNFRMLVLLGPHFVVPPELDQDVVTLDDPLPDPAALSHLITELHASFKPPLPAPKPEALERAVDAVSGLSAFAAEQILSLSFDENLRGLNLPMLWERKRQMIEQTPGLSVHRGKETFDDLRGLESVKARLRSHIHAKTPIGVVVWIDEGADVFQNVEQDTTGVKTDQQRGLLMDMEQYGWRGVILVGVAGGGKSALAGAFGNEAGVQTICMDPGGMESKWQGESEQNLRTALRVIHAVGRGHAFFVLTCNSLRGIRPQFQRRFRRGVFFFDLPSAAEREAIWTLYLAKYGLPEQPRPDDIGWTGAEIRECCESAWDTGVSLVEAARYIIPVSRSRATEIEEMRREAHGRFLDASNPGAYQYEAEPMAKQIRAITLPGAMIDQLVTMKES